jgi:Transposase DDE domain
MILCQELPGGKAFFALCALPVCYTFYVTRFLLGFLILGPRVSATAIGSACRTNPRHCGNVIRFLRRLPASVRDDWIEALFGNLLADEPPTGTWLFILDQTYCGHNSSRMQNGYSTSPRGKRKKQADRKDKRKKRKKQPQSYCHCFVMGLLITPSGVRLPLCKSYYTEEYCTYRGWKYRKQTELAAQLIDGLRVPAGAKVVVLGDTAFDAERVLAACQRRHFSWIVAMNGDRVLASEKKERDKVTDLSAKWTEADYVPVRLTPGEGHYEAQRRCAACRVGLRRKSRDFWVHVEKLEMHNVGTVQVLYSTMQKPAAGQAVTVQKVLMTSDLSLSVEDIVELYDLRWQIEVFFRECKSTLGLDRYHFEDFDCVESWVSLCLLTFLYLEWYRVQELRETTGNAKEKHRWQWQRCHGLALAVRQDVEAADLLALHDLLQTPEGVQRLKEQLRRAVQKKYRKAA